MEWHCMRWDIIWFVVVCRQKGKVAASATWTSPSFMLHHSDLRMSWMKYYKGQSNYYSSHLSLASHLIPLSLHNLSPALFSIIFIDSVWTDSHQKDGEGPNWKFWFRKLQSSGSFGNLVISQIVKNVNIKVSVHLSPQ